MQGLFAFLTERWDGKGRLGRAAGTRSRCRCGSSTSRGTPRSSACSAARERAARTVVRERAGDAFDPAIATLLADEAAEILALDRRGSAWDETARLRAVARADARGRRAIDRGARGDGRLRRPRLAVPSSATRRVSRISRRRPRGAAGSGAASVARVRRAGARPRPRAGRGPRRASGRSRARSTPDEWEQVRLHAYHTERVLARSPFLATLAPFAGAHHERLDGSGYHRGATAAALTAPSTPARRRRRLPRDDRAATAPAALTAERAAETLRRGVPRRAASTPTPSPRCSTRRASRSRGIERPAGLTEREVEVVGLLARGLQTKQVARMLGISPKTADHHIQNAYAKIGVSTRAAATLFAMEHGLASWENSRLARARAAAPSVLERRFTTAGGVADAHGGGSAWRPSRCSDPTRDSRTAPFLEAEQVALGVLRPPSHVRASSRLDSPRVPPPCPRGRLGRARAARPRHGGPRLVGVARLRS